MYLQWLNKFYESNFKVSDYAKIPKFTFLF